MSKAYGVTLYHDEPEEASADARGLATYFTSKKAALNAGRRHLGDYWQTGDIGIGEYTPAEFGVRPPRFEYDEDAVPIRFGKDWIE